MRRFSVRAVFALVLIMLTMASVISTPDDGVYVTATSSRVVVTRMPGATSTVTPAPQVEAFIHRSDSSASDSPRPAAMSPLETPASPLPTPIPTRDCGDCATRTYTPTGGPPSATPTASPTRLDVTPVRETPILTWPSPTP